jgi:hypothetical protein
VDNSNDPLMVALNEACPTSIAAGQIPRAQIMAILKPLADEVIALRARVALLEARNEAAKGEW